MTWFLDEVTTDVVEVSGMRAAIAYGHRGFALPGEDTDDIAARLPDALAASLGGDCGPVVLALRYGDPRTRATWGVTAVPDTSTAVLTPASLPRSLASRLAAEVGDGCSTDVPDDALSFLMADLAPSTWLRPTAVADARARMAAMSGADWAGAMRILVFECGVGPGEVSEALGLAKGVVLGWCLGHAEPRDATRGPILDEVDPLLAKREAAWASAREYEEARVSDILSRLGPGPSESTSGHTGSVGAGA